MSDVKIDQATLEKQDGLTDDQASAIALAAIAEMDAEVKKKPDEEPAGEQAEKKAESAPIEETTKPAEESKPAQEDKSKEEERLLNAKEEELSEEDKGKKAEIVKLKEDDKAKALQQEIADYAKEHSVTEQEAREDIEHIAKIQEKYKGDAKQLAKANLHLQRLYSKTESEAKSLKDKSAADPAKEITAEAVEKYMAEGKVTVNGKPVSKEQTIEAYRNAYPDLTDTLDDDKVFKLAVKEYKQHLDKAITEQRADVSVKAKDKRATMFDSIPEADKRFVADTKPLIEKLSDEQIMNPAFSLDTYITFAKGMAYETASKQFEEDKKAFGEKEYKRGLEEAKILGTRRTPGGGPPKGSGDITLNDFDKKRAREMFDNPEITEEQAYKLYKDYLKETKQS